MVIVGIIMFVTGLDKLDWVVCNYENRKGWLSIFAMGNFKTGSGTLGKADSGATGASLQ